MPPKRRSSGIAPKSGQSTLAFHGASNKVTKPGTRAQNTKKNIVADPVAESPKADVVEIDATVGSEPTTTEASLLDQTEKEIVAQQAASTPEEDEARRITDARINKYWTAKEKARKAPRVHQNGLSLHEKILQEWDMSGQYGPCTGIARLKRWKRAQRLGLTPPIEVLAVLLKEQDSENDSLSVQRSLVDELLNY
ncbi:DNA polymeras-like protein delta subunit 4 [Clohesyomyces aquaticus]|uniref:DNA polymeras-like protein delta subunit 4 n=1 Tax=Clohesyomyces aquaticus TaxID=1231657 RepID=A0A1Y1ZHG2_9PLEO|nr:DNA polymeras-like protein delta subunit 4 [Clohesyomyces aquaticus]